MKSYWLIIHFTRSLISGVACTEALKRRGKCSMTGWHSTIWSKTLGVNFLPPSINTNLCIIPSREPNRISAFRWRLSNKTFSINILNQRQKLKFNAATHWYQQPKSLTSWNLRFTQSFFSRKFLQNHQAKVNRNSYFVRSRYLSKQEIPASKINWKKRIFGT